MKNNAPHVLLDARFRGTNLGGDRCRFELAQHLLDLEIENTTYLLQEQARSKIDCAKFVTTDLMPSQHPGADIFEHIKLPKIARKLAVDIYHGTFNILPLIKTAPVEIVTIHDMAVFAFPEAYAAKFALYMRFLIDRTIKKASQIITVSEATKQEILRYYPGRENQIVTILNGVGREFGEARNISEEQLSVVKQRYNIGKPYVLFVGNLERKKNLGNLIRAFEKFRDAYSLDYQLVIVGKPLDRGPDGGFVVSETMDFVHFTGYVQDADLPALYRAAALIAYPSLYEGFGMPVAEGMAAGVPVLTSTVSSLPEVAGGAAMLVDPNDVEDMARGIYQALTDVNWRRHAINKGRERAEFLSWKKNASATKALYESIWNSRISSACHD